MNAIDIKKKRKKLGLTQEKLAKLIGVSKRTIINYEKGEVIPTTKSEILRRILSNVEYSTVDTAGDMIVGDPRANYNKANAASVDFTEMSVMFVPLVSQYAQAGFLNGFDDDEYIEDLPKVPFASDQVHKGDYLCFEVKGDSMDDGSSESYLEGDILLCRNLRQDLWKSKLHINKYDFVIVHRTEGILVKRITAHNTENGILTLHSLNDFYEDFNIHLKDVVKLFNIVNYRRKRSR